MRTTDRNRTTHDSKTVSPNAPRVFVAVRKRGRWLRACVAVLIAGSIIAAWWMLARPLDPDDPRELAWYEWAPRKLKTLAVNAIGTQVRAHIRNKLEAEQFKTDLRTE